MQFERTNQNFMMSFQHFIVSSWYFQLLEICDVLTEALIGAIYLIGAWLAAAYESGTQLIQNIPHK